MSMSRSHVSQSCSGQGGMWVW